MPTLPVERRPTPLRRRTSDALAVLCRPLLRISFALYQLEVRRNLYPRDALVRSIPGFDPQRVLFVGDVAASGHGVLSHGLTVVTRTADFLTLSSGRGAEISLVGQTDLTLERFLQRPSLAAEGAEIAFLIIGIPDVLLMTTTERWEAQLEEAVHRVQRESGNRSCRVVVSGIPPLVDFRPISPAVRRIIVGQVSRLNAVSADLAERTPGLTFVPFPTWRIGEMYIKQMFSWKAMHEAWAQTLAAAVAPAGPVPPPPVRDF